MKTPVFSGDLKNILKGVSRTLYLSIKVLPAPVKTSMGMGYLLARTMDTIVDCPGIAPGEKLEMLRLFRGLHNKSNSWALAAKIKQAALKPADPREKELLFKFEKILAVYSAFPQQERALLDSLINGVAKGMEMDVALFGTAPGVSALKTEEELKSYCALIGGEPGIFWARLYREAIRRNNINIAQFPSETAACLIGSALQMTNILKDLAADLRIGRCYLPACDLARKNLSPADLLNAENMERLRSLVYKWIGWAVDGLDLSEEFVASIPKTELALRAAVIWPVYWAMDTLLEAAKANLLDPSARPRIKRNKIYSTILSTPPLLLSNTAFARGYRFKREILILLLSGR
ncbi:MAG: squalene/phytoene synthase family protein [Elusimicrobia bacterium]|nr:squalene/phytoene synthase family protein [Elusimicrobiota bacterium]